MIKSIKLCLLALTIAWLTGCAVANINSQMAPNASLTPRDPLYLEVPGNLPIGQQKYIAALRDVLHEQGFSLVRDKARSKNVMTVEFADFSSPLVRNVADVKTTISNGNIGSVPVSNTSTTIGNAQSYSEIPTHNSGLTVRDRKSNSLVWQVSMAKSYDVYNHKDLKKIIEKMISLYGKDGKTVQAVGDDLRW